MPCKNGHSFKIYQSHRTNGYIYYKWRDMQLSTFSLIFQKIQYFAVLLPAQIASFDIF